MEEVKSTKTTNNITIWRLIEYFLFYSFAGFIIETIFGILTKGVWESRKSFLYGPFCGIYGVGAIVMILFFNRLSKDKNSLFFGGIIIGSITEYMISYLGEMLLGVKWWDYSGRAFNVNGRICLLFSIFWGILAIYLIGHLNPKIDKILDYIDSKININILKTFLTISIIFIIFDFLISMYAVNLFEVRMIVLNNINVKNIDKVNYEYTLSYGNEKFANFIYKYWSDETMIKTYPNLKIKDVTGNIIYFDSLKPEIQTYYHKFK